MSRGIRSVPGTASQSTGDRAALSQGWACGTRASGTAPEPWAPLPPPKEGATKKGQTWWEEGGGTGGHGARPGCLVMAAGTHIRCPRAGGGGCQRACPRALPSSLKFQNLFFLVTLEVTDTLVLAPSPCLGGRGQKGPVPPRVHPRSTTGGWGPGKGI